MLERVTAVVPVDQRDLLDELEAGQLAVELDDATPQEVIAYALDRWGSQVAICTSFQIEGMAILDMAWRIDPKVRLFTVDTGRLHQETHDVIETVRQRYGIEVEVYSPDARQVENMVRHFGPNLFQRSVQGRVTCCNVRKVEPIRGALEGLDAWVTGLRRDQWASRANIRKIEIDHDHGGLTKINPLADWTLDEVKAYNEEHDVPIHPLYAKGYTSIGCAPCTRPTSVGEDPRAGRWWWETNAPKECGIHCTIETGSFERGLDSMLHPGPRRPDR
jgi:thioredoxin-dependent adenylylsulfate APS reductase